MRVLFPSVSQGKEMHIFVSWVLFARFCFCPPIRGITCDQHRRSPSPQKPGLTSDSSNEGKRIQAGKQSYVTPLSAKRFLELA